MPAKYRFVCEANTSSFKTVRIARPFGRRRILLNIQCRQWQTLLILAVFRLCWPWIDVMRQDLLILICYAEMRWCCFKHRFQLGKCTKIKRNTGWSTFWIDCDCTYRSIRCMCFHRNTVLNVTNGSQYTLSSIMYCRRFSPIWTPGHYLSQSWRIVNWTLVTNFSEAFFTPRLKHLWTGLWHLKLNMT